MWQASIPHISIAVALAMFAAGLAGSGPAPSADEASHAIERPDELADASAWRAAGALAGSHHVALHEALRHTPGYLGMAPDPAADVAVVYGGPAPPGVALLTTLDVRIIEHASPERLRMQVSQVTDLEPAQAMADGVPPLPEDAVGIGPGSPILQTIPGEGTFICSANFVFEDNGRYYLGSAGHCFLPPDREATHGAGADYDASRVVVQVCVDFCHFGGFFTGFLGDMETLGSVAYARQTGSGGDIGNDFGVVAIPDDLLPRVRPEMPMWDGPTGQDSNEGFGNPVVHYGNGIDAGTFMASKGRAGSGLNDGDPTSWQANIFINGGDSGSAISHGDVVAGDGFAGTLALGLVTHGLIIPGTPLGWGTTITQALSMATEANLQLALVLEGQTIGGGSGGGSGGTATAVHVHDLDGSFQHFGNRGHRVTTTVTVHDDQGRPASGVTVDVETTAPDGTVHTDSGTTDSSGQVTFQAQDSRGGHGDWESCVTALRGSGFTHDASADRETCTTITVT